MVCALSSGIITVSSSQEPSLVDRSSISQIHIAQIIYAVFQCSASAKNPCRFLPWSVSLIYRMKPRSPLDLFCVLGLHDAVIDPNILGPNLISSSAERNGLTNSRMVSFSCSDDAAPSERKVKESAHSQFHSPVSPNNTVL